MKNKEEKLKATRKFSRKIEQAQTDIAALEVAIEDPFAEQDMTDKERMARIAQNNENFILFSKRLVSANLLMFLFLHRTEPLLTIINPVISDMFFSYSSVLSIIFCCYRRTLATTTMNQFIERHY